MVLRHFMWKGGLGLLIGFGVFAARAADPPPLGDPALAPEKARPEAAPSARPGWAEFERRREEWNKLSPEEKELRKKAYFEKTGKPMFSRKDFEKRCQEWEKLPAEVQREKIREWREHELALRDRFQKHLAELRIKQKEGTLDEDDAKRLERMEVLARRFETTRHHHHGSPRDRPNREGRESAPSQDGPAAE